MRSARRARRIAGWSKQSAYLRGQILYRAAEMLEMRRRANWKRKSRAIERRAEIACA